MITLTLRATLSSRLEVDGVTADRLAMLGEQEIAELPVWLGARVARLGDFFTVAGGRSSQVHVVGDLAQVDGLAGGMAGGELTIDGDIGQRLAAGMTGGSIEVRGRAGDEAGVSMAGGSLRINGDAGDRLAAALPGASKGMTGGEVLVRGSAGTDAGARMRRGLVVVAGHVGDQAARDTIAGTLVVLGMCGAAPGRGSKRGSIIAAGGITVPDTYQYACTFEPPHVRLTMTYLRRRYGLAIEDRVVSGRYRRHCGDAGVPGRGEILELI